MTVTTLPPTSRRPNPLIELLEQQRNLYLQLKELSDRQAALIAEGETEHLLTVLAQRQRLVDGLVRLNRDLATCRQSAPDVGSMPSEQRDRVRSLMDEVDGLLHSIIEQDDRDRASLQAAQRDVGAQLRQTRGTGAALRAYRGYGDRPEARFTDHQG